MAKRTARDVAANLEGVECGAVRDGRITVKTLTKIGRVKMDGLHEPVHFRLHRICICGAGIGVDDIVVVEV